MKKPLILVANDDGIVSKGIATLVKIMKQIGDVVVVAPDSPQSAMGHAITISKPIWLSKTSVFEGVTEYQCSGTPADCIKLAKSHVLTTQKRVCLYVTWSPLTVTAMHLVATNTIHRELLVALCHIALT